MTVKSSELEVPERDLDLVTRTETRPARKRDDGAEAAELGQLRQLRDRLEDAKRTKPQDDAPHCGDCFRRGWEAALKALEG